MPPTVNQGVQLPLLRKIRRLGSRLQDAQWRRYGMTLLAGKVLGVAAVMLIAMFVTDPIAPATGSGCRSSAPSSRNWAQGWS